MTGTSEAIQEARARLHPRGTSVVSAVRDRAEVMEG
jgi:hypothetical protein